MTQTPSSGTLYVHIIMKTFYLCFTYSTFQMFGMFVVVFLGKEHLYAALN